MEYKDIKTVTTVDTVGNNDCVLAVVGGSLTRIKIKDLLSEGESKFAEDILSYGVRFSNVSSSPDGVRVGNPSLHRELPVHNLLKGVLLSDEGQVTRYLNPLTWEDEDRTGASGQVMVSMPLHKMYWKRTITEEYDEMRFSLHPLKGFSQIFSRGVYEGAYKASLQRSNTTLASVANMSDDYRGGNNNSDWDDTYRDLRGMAVTGLSDSQFRSYARKRKAGSFEWNAQTELIRNVVAWLFYVEYATRNAQKPYNSALTSEGFRQGGLGSGVTDINVDWSTHNGAYPIVPNGVSDKLGNGTGVVIYPIEKADGGVYNAPVVRYRGIENPFGHIYERIDGVLIDCRSDGETRFYSTNEPEFFNSSDFSNYRFVGLLPRTDGYVKKLIRDEVNCSIMPSVVGGSSSTYYCDNFYTSADDPSFGLRGLVVGGHAVSSSFAGFAFSHSLSAPSNAGADYGSRLCFISAK